MKLDALPDGVRLYGDASYRGTCPLEDAEQAAFFARLRIQHPRTWGIIALHPRNEGEGKRTGAQLRRGALHRAQGLAKGASDIIIPGAPAFVCELKRKDRTKSAWQPGQIDYLQASAKAGAFTCLALGYEAAWNAFGDWLDMQAHK